jgi:hypothetical protein
MTYAFLQDVPITLDIYEEIVAGLGDDPPEGLVVHITQVLDEGHLRYLDIWESQAACERFTQERLHPVVGPVLARHHVRPDREPERRPVEIADVWVGPAGTARQEIRSRAAALEATGGDSSS